MVPVIAPVELLRLRPVGSEPPGMENTTGGIPQTIETPLATLPTAIPERDVETIVIAAAGFDATVPTNDLDCV